MQTISITMLIFLPSATNNGCKRSPVIEVSETIPVEQRTKTKKWKGSRLQTFTFHRPVTSVSLCSTYLRETRKRKQLLQEVGSGNCWTNGDRRFRATQGNSLMEQLSDLQQQSNGSRKKKETPEHCEWRDVHSWRKTTWWIRLNSTTKRANE